MHHIVLINILKILVKTKSKFSVTILAINSLFYIYVTHKKLEKRFKCYLVVEQHLKRKII